MGQSTDGQICYGILFEEGFEFPWDGFADDIEGWWIDEVHGYKPPFEIYDADGNYLNGVEPSPEQEDRYFSHRDRFKNKIPKLPVELVNVCSGDYPTWILAVSGTVKTANRGHPTKFEPPKLSVSDKDVLSFLDFCKEHKIKHGKPAWYLSSYWG